MWILSKSSDVINGYMEPVKHTEKAMDELVATSFINEVDMSTPIFGPNFDARYA